MADLKISDMVSGGVVTGAELFECVQGGATRKLSHSQLSATPIASYAGVNYTLVLGDQGKVVESTGANPNTLTVPPESAVAFPVGATVLIRQYGTGKTTVAGGAGVTIVKKASRTASLIEQYSEAVLHKRDVDTWLLTGELELL
jgi:hypothetical protein